VIFYEDPDVPEYPAWQWHVLTNDEVHARFCADDDWAAVAAENEAHDVAAADKAAVVGDDDSDGAS
jgi:hypothetical protein